MDRDATILPPFLIPKAVLFCGRGSPCPDTQVTHAEWRARLRPARYAHCGQDSSQVVITNVGDTSGGGASLRQSWSTFRKIDGSPDVLALSDSGSRKT